MSEAMAVMNYEKLLTLTDVSQKLTVLGYWREILPKIEDNNDDVQIRVLDGKGMYWEFYLSERSTGNYPKPVFQSKEWLVFVREKGLMVGDKFVIDKEDDHFRGTQYRVRVHRLEGRGGDDEGCHWVDLDLLEEVHRLAS